MFLYSLNIYKPSTCCADDESLVQPYVIEYSIDINWLRLFAVLYPSRKCKNNEFLMLFGKNEDFEVVEWLMRKGVGSRTDDRGFSQYACEHGHLENTKHLLSLIDDDERKLHIRACNNCVLRLSARYGHLEVVKWLVNNGANFRVNNCEAFQYACEYGHVETAKHLLNLINTDEEKKLCVQSRDEYSLTTSTNKGHLEVVKLLTRNGADIRFNIYGAFRFACEKGHLKIAKHLFHSINTDEEKKLCIHTNDDDALRSSAENGHLEVVKWLIKNGANIRVNNYEAFRYACKYGHLETAEYLLGLIDTDDEEKQLCIHSDNDYALRWSAENGHLEVVKWLIKNGANIRVNNYEAFRYACKYGHLETAEYLLDLLDDAEGNSLFNQIISISIEAANDESSS